MDKTIVIISVYFQTLYEARKLSEAIAQKYKDFYISRDGYSYLENPFYNFRFSCSRDPELFAEEIVKYIWEMTGGFRYTHVSIEESITYDEEIYESMKHCELVEKQDILANNLKYNIERMPFCAIYHNWREINV